MTIDVNLSEPTSWLDVVTGVAQVAALGTLLFLFLVYRKDKKWQRSEGAYKFYNDFDSSKEAQLAMFMLDHQTGDAPVEFTYQFPKTSTAVHVTYDLAKRRSALSKSPDLLAEEEQVIRFIMDVYIGYFERIFYLIKQGYFTDSELIFYKYWLDKLVSPECEDIRVYAVKNSCGMFVPFLGRYKENIQAKLNRQIRF